MIASATSTVISVIAGLALLPLIISRIGAAPYGLWLLLSTTATYLYQSDFGMGAGLVHFLSRHRADSQELQRKLTATGFVSMAVGGLVALPVYLVVATLFVNGKAHSAHVTHQQATVLLALGAVLIACSGLRAFPSALAGFGYWVFQRNSQVAGSLVRIVATVAVCVLGHSLILIAVVESGVLLLPMVICAAKACRVGLIGFHQRYVDRSVGRTMLNYSRRAFVVGAMAIVLLQADTLIVGVVASAAAVTYYGAALRIYTTLTQSLGWISDPLMPAMSRLYATDRDRATGLFSGMLFATLWLAVAACGSFMLASPALFSLWLGAGVPVSALSTVLCILLSGLVLSSIHEAAIPASDATGDPGAFAALYICWTLANIVLSFVLGFLLGIEGVALGTTVPLLVLEPLFLRRIEARLSVTVRDWMMKCLVPILGLALAAGFSALIVGGLVATTVGFTAGSATAGIVFGVVYLVCSTAFRSRLPMDSLRSLAKADI